MSQRGAVRSLPSFLDGAGEKTLYFPAQVLVLGLARNLLMDHKTGLVENEGQMGRCVLDVPLDCHKSAIFEDLGEVPDPTRLETGILDSQDFVELRQTFSPAPDLGLVDAKAFHVRLSPLKVATGL